MAKVIKFALELKNGESARTIEDLRQYFDLEKVIAYFMNGRLLTWLRHRHLDEEAAALEKLSADDAGFTKKLCDILGVAYDEYQKTADTIDTTALMADHERLNRLRQVTTDPEILAKIDRVAFDEKDLRRLAFDDTPEVYLCNGRFVVPLNVQNKHYIGLGKAEAVIVSDELVDFKEKGIRFTNVSFDEEYQKITDEETPEKWLEKGDKAETALNNEEAIKWFRKSSEAGNGDAMYRMGNIYRFQMYDDKTAAEWYIKAAKSGSADGMDCLAHMYEYGYGVEQNKEKAIQWYQQAANAGSIWGMIHLGDVYCYGKGIAQDSEKAIEWYKKAAEAGNFEAMFQIGWIYAAGHGVPQDDNKSLEWYQKAADAGYSKASYEIGMLYIYAMDFPGNDAKSAEWFIKAAQQGHDRAMYFTGLNYWEGKGLIRDEKQARYWMQKAADLGYEDAQKWLQEH